MTAVDPDIEEFLRYLSFALTAHYVAEHWQDITGGDPLPQSQHFDQLEVAGYYDHS